jgi:hypothetical protein
MIYEPSLNEGETRDAYLEQFRRVNRPAWTFLSDQEWAQIDHHVTTCDLPETSATWLKVGREAGFGRATELFCDPTGFHRIYRYDAESRALLGGLHRGFCRNYKSIRERYSSLDVEGCSGETGGGALKLDGLNEVGASG